jgi:hypothetical protein
MTYAKIYLALLQRDQRGFFEAVRAAYRQKAIGGWLHAKCVCPSVRDGQAEYEPVGKWEDQPNRLCALSDCE